MTIAVDSHSLRSYHPFPFSASHALQVVHAAERGMLVSVPSENVSLGPFVLELKGSLRRSRKAGGQDQYEMRRRNGRGADECYVQGEDR